MKSIYTYDEIPDCLKDKDVICKFIGRFVIFRHWGHPKPTFEGFCEFLKKKYGE